MARTTRQGGWSYSAGERGRNRVRVFERSDRNGGILLHYAEPGPDGRLTPRRVSLGQISRAVAKAKADELAARFATLGPSTAPAPLTLQALFDSYDRDASHEKSPAKRQHDARCADMFVRLLGADRAPQSLSRREWDRFIADRRRGVLAPRGRRTGRKVGPRAVEYDLRHLLAVLNWATMASDGRGGVLLERNPLKGLALPKEESPRRAVLTADQYEALRGAAARSDPVLELFVVLVHETGHRAGSIRRLRWSDVDLERRAVRWRGEFDKMRSEHVTPLSDGAVAVLSAVQRRQGAIGDTWIFPRPEDSAEPWSAHQASKRFRTIADAVGLPLADRYGWHAFRRQFASELKAAPLKDLCHLGGWKNEQTVLRCYQVADEATQRAALAQRKSLRVSGLS